MAEPRLLNEPVAFAGVMPPLSVPGFSAPVFGDGEALYLQCGGKGELLRGFLPLPESDRTHVVRRPAGWSGLQKQHDSIGAGERLQFAFAVDHESMFLGDAGWMKHRLREWLTEAGATDSARQRHPFTVLDVAEFVGEDTRRLATAIDDCKRYLNRKGLSQSDEWAQRQRTHHGLPNPTPSPPRDTPPLRSRSRAAEARDPPGPRQSPVQGALRVVGVLPPGSRSNQFDGLNIVFNGRATVRVLGLPARVAVVECPLSPHGCPARYSGSSAECDLCGMKIVGPAVPAAGAGDLPKP